jgi:hypothetical protein
MAAGGRALQVLQAVRDTHGNDTLAAVYTGVGTRLHEKQQQLDADLVAAALADAGLDEGLAGAAEDESVQAEVARSHAEGQEAVGQESGSPIIAIDGGPGFFGPVVVPPPEGEQARTLF